MYTVPKHIWRTTDDRLVPHGDLEAAFLAYPAGTEMSDHDAEARGVPDVYPDEEPDAGPEVKSVTEHGDKSVTEHGDKGAGGNDPDDAPLEEPKKSGSKPDWVEWAVSKGADREEAEASSRDDLAAAYGTK